MTTQAQPVPAHKEVPSWRLLATLGVAGALAGLLIVLSYMWTLPRITRHRAEVLQGAISQVLQNPDHADTLFLVNGALTTQAPPTNGAAERIYRGVSSSGATTGYAVVASEAGFADQIQLMFGFNAGTGELLGIRFLSSKETPGLGDKIEKSGFAGQFAGAIAPLKGVKDAASRTGDPSAILMITGATISSRTVIREINNAVERWRPLISAFEAGGVR